MIRNSFEDNRQAARYIEARPENAALDCLRPWATMFLEGHGLTSPVTPPIAPGSEAEVEFELKPVDSPAVGRPGIPDGRVKQLLGAPAP